MNHRLIGTMVTAASILASGILLGVVYLNIFIPFPFILAAYQYFVTYDVPKKSRLLIIGSLAIIFFGLILGLNFITEGINEIISIEGGAIVVLSITAIALIVFPFLTNKAIPQAAPSNSSS